MNSDDLYVLPLHVWIQRLVEWMAMNLHSFFDAVKAPVSVLLSGILWIMSYPSPPILILILTILAYFIANIRVALFSLSSFTFIALIGVWSAAVTTLALILTAVVFCVLISIPLGIISASSEIFWRCIRPVLDVMQATPTLVYLVPIVMLLGAGTVPGEVAVVIAAAPPLIRLTNLGIRQVPHETVEAGMAFGASRWQLLMFVQLPLAVPTILAGLNQTVMNAMVMAVIIAMIGAEGLGLVVLQGLGRLDVGQAAVGGIGIVLLAMVLDRITQAAAISKEPKRKNRLNPEPVSTEIVSHSLR